MGHNRAPGVSLESYRRSSRGAIDYLQRAANRSMMNWIIFLAVVPFAMAEDKPPVFPAHCQEKCISPYGIKLGATEGGVEAYSNCQSKCVYTRPSMVGSDFAGIEWQCVEFARRWLIKEKGLTFGSIDVAADLWSKVNYLEKLKTKERVQLHPVLNGAAGPPSPGDLLVYGRDYLETGHVAVVLRVSHKRQLIYVGEENFANAPWPGSFSRKIPYVKHGKEVWLLDRYLLGWLTY